MIEKLSPAAQHQLLLQNASTPGVPPVPAALPGQHDMTHYSDELVEELKETSAANGSANFGSLLQGLAGLPGPASDEVVLPTGEASRAQGLEGARDMEVPTPVDASALKPEPAPEPTPQQMESRAQDGPQSQAPEGTRESQGSSPMRFEGGFTEDTPLIELKEPQMKGLFKENAAKMMMLAQRRSDLKVRDVMPLRKEPNKIDPAVKVLSERRDLKVNDLMTKKPGSQPEFGKVITDENTQNLILQRHDLKPQQLEKMETGFKQALKNPALGEDAYQTAIPLLKQRQDVQPEQLGTMMDRMVTGAGDGAAGLSMFKSGVKLMQNRSDTHPEQVTRLSDEVSGLARRSGDANPGRIASTFGQATDLLIEQPHRGVQDVVELAQSSGPGGGGALGAQGGGPGQGGPGPAGA
ncbi:MAG: hypothetical protein AB1758_35630, partial [Candidatus Eremiobacterota bacterium]